MSFWAKYWVTGWAIVKVLQNSHFFATKSEQEYQYNIDKKQLVKSWKGWIDTNLFWPCMICRYLIQLYRPFPNLKAFALICDAQKRSKAENETLVHWIFFNARIGRSMNNSTYILVSVYTYFSSSISINQVVKSHVISTFPAWGKPVLDLS